MMDDYNRRANFVLKERLLIHRKISDATEMQSIVKVLKDVFDLLHDSFGLHPLPETLADPNILCKYYKDNLYVSRDINRDKAENLLMVIGLRGKKGHRQLLIHTFPEGGFKKTDVFIKIDNNLLVNFKSKIFPYLRNILGQPEQHKNKEKILGSITKIYLENFKSIKDRQVIELKPITLLFGPNSAGKSTVIQALHYMREILVRQNFNADRTMYGGEVIDLGGFRNLVYNHDISLPIVMRFDLNLEKLDLPSYNPYTDFDFYFEETYENEDGVLESRQREERNIIDNIYYNAKSAYVQVTVKWNDELNKAIVTEYETGFNDIKMASITLNRIMASGIGFYEITDLQIVHPVFEKKNLELIRESLEVTDLFLWFMDWFGWSVDKLKEGVTFPIKNQKTAIPNWGNFIKIEQNFLKESDESIDYLNTQWFIPEFFTTILTGPGELLKNLLEKFRYIGPIRKIPQRYFVPTKTPNEARWADGLAAWDLLYKSEGRLLDEVNKYLFKKDYLNTGYEIKFMSFRSISDSSTNFTYEKIKESFNNYFSDKFKKNIVNDDYLDISLKIFNDNMNKINLNIENFWEKIIELKGILKIVDKNNKVELSLKDVGVGISQIIPVLVGAVSQEYSILSVEQPELHNHPKIQVSLADVFIEQINKKPDVIYLLETHSEHFMLRLLRRIEETTENEVPTKELKLQPDQISVNWFEPDKNGTKIINLPIDETGEFTKPWPQGFFEERAGELFR